MATTPSPNAASAPPDYLKILVAIVVGIVAFRLIALSFTPLDLFYDEAQYWYWGQNLDWGYFSKPPLIGWLIGLSTNLCGNAEACVRVAAPLFHGATTLAVYLLGNTVYNARTGFYAALGYLLAMGVSASSFIISTDVPLLLCWTLGLWAFARYTEQPRLAHAIAFGLAIAIGINAKYAMIYFPLCAVLYLVATSDKRGLFRRADLWLGLLLGLGGFLPNLIWNAQNDFITFDHTGDNISGMGLTLSPVSFVEFFGSQFAVAGPILFAALIIALSRRWRSDKPATDRLLLFFSLPILMLLSVQAFQSSANYNWAATAFPALILVTTAILLDRGKFLWIRWNLIVCAFFAALVGCALLAVLLLRPDHPVVAQTNLEDMYGWAEHAEEIGEHIDRLDVDTIVTVGRRYSAGFAYYMRDRQEPIRAYVRAGATPRNHFELASPWNEPSPGERAIIISPGNISPITSARLVAVIEANDGAVPFRSNSYLFLAEGHSD